MPFTLPNIHLCQKLTNRSVLQEAVALVTGGASGLGKCTVQCLLKHGFKVALLDLSSSNGAFLSKSLGAKCEFVQADVIFDFNCKIAPEKPKYLFVLLVT